MRSGGSTAQTMPRHAMPGDAMSVLTISFSCFSRLSARWPCPWPDCVVAAILQLGEGDLDADADADVDRSWAST